MEKENKNKEESEELCCADKNFCSIDCDPKDKESSESKRGGCCS